MDKCNFFHTVIWKKLYSSTINNLYNYIKCHRAYGITVMTTKNFRLYEIYYEKGQFQYICLY